MDARLSDFLQYDHAEARALATTLLTTAGGLVAGGIVFAKEFIGLHLSPRLRVWRKGMGGLYAFAVAGLCAGAALIFSYTEIVTLRLHNQAGVKDAGRFAAEVASFDQGQSLLFFLAGDFILIGLGALYAAADDRRRELQASAAHPKPSSDPAGDGSP